MIPDRTGTARSWFKPCDGCGQDFKVKRSKAHLRFCSMACKSAKFMASKERCGHCSGLIPGRVDRRNVVNYCGPGCYQLARSAAAITPRHVPLAAHVKEEIAALRRIGAFIYRGKTVRPCWGCGAKTIGTMERKRVCDACQRARIREKRKTCPAYKASKRADKARRRAIERGLHADRIDPIAVFERDGWACYMCGVHTPKGLRGSYEPNAPELDHVVPLALGGAHTWANVKCSCRQCNGDKGAVPLGILAGVGKNAPTLQR